MTFETSPVYRGRKPSSNCIILSRNSSWFETSPVYRGRKLHYRNLRSYILNFSLKLAPYIGDGNFILSSGYNDLSIVFETSPVYRGRKLNVNFNHDKTPSAFETSPVYRGRKLFNSFHYKSILSV